MKKPVDIDELVGKTFTAVNNKDDEIIEFVVSDNEQYEMYHNQDCCESVVLEDINGDLTDLVGVPILSAEEVFSDERPPDRLTHTPESYTWSFYHFRTIKGYVTLRWYGESNGYYSEKVNLYKVADDNQ